MDAKQYQRIHELFDCARAMSPSERPEFLDQACDGDADTRAAVDRLLESRAPGIFTDTRLNAQRHRLEHLVVEYPPAPSIAPAITDVGPYRIIRRVAQGGMGVVYEAEQESPRRRVALKMVHTQRATSSMVERLQRESEILGRLQHPGIAQVYDAGTIDLGEGAQPYFAMEYIDGVTLSKFAEQHRMDDRARLDLLATICDAVHYAHGKGVIHRDLKPDNILVDQDGRPKVLDFGVARVTSDTTFDVSTMTREGQIIGTLSYMAPEQMHRGEGAITAAADVYALGVIGFELLAHRLPHDLTDLSIAAALRQLMDHDPPALHSIDARFRGDVRTIIGTALERDPARRYPSAAAMAGDIRRYFDNKPIRARPPGAVYRTRKFVARNRAVVTGTAATVVVLLAGIVATTWFAIAERQQRELAAQNAVEAQRGEASVVSTVMASAVRDLESGDVWSAYEQHQAVPESSRGWGWRVLAQRLPNVRPSWDVPSGPNSPFAMRGSFAGDTTFIAFDGTCRCIRVHAVDDTDESRSAFGELRLRGASLGTSTGLVAAWSDDSLYVLDVTAGEIVDRIAVDSGILHASLSDDGRVVAFRPRRGASSVRMNGEVVYECEAPSELRDDLPHLLVAPDGQRVYANMVHAVEVFDIATRKTNVVEPREPFDLLRANPKRGGWFVFESQSDTTTTARVQFLPHGVMTLPDNDLPPTVTLPAPASRVDGPDDGRFAVFENAGCVRLIPLDGTTSRLTVYQDADGNVDLGDRYNCIPRVSPSGRNLVVLSYPRPPWVVSLDKRSLESSFDPRCTTFRAHEGFAYHFAVSTDGSLVASMSMREPFIRLWDARTLRTIATHPRSLVEYASRDALVAFSEDDDALIFSAPLDDVNGAAVVRWDLTDGTREVFYPDEPVTEGNHAPLLDLVVQHLSSNSRVRLSQKAQMFNGKALTIWNDYLSGFDFPDESSVHAGRHWRTIHQPDVPENFDTIAISVHPTEPHVATVGAMTLAPGASSRDGALIVRHVHDGSILHTIDVPNFARSAAYSPDGSLLALGSDNGRIVLLETRFYTVRADFKAHDAYIYSIAWMCDGHRLVTTSGDGTIRIWDDRPLDERDSIRQQWLTELEQARAGGADVGPAAARIAAIERWAGASGSTTPADGG